MHVHQLVPTGIRGSTFRDVRSRHNRNKKEVRVQLENQHHQGTEITDQATNDVPESQGQASNPSSGDGASGSPEAGSTPAMVRMVVCQSEMAIRPLCVLPCCAAGKIPPVTNAGTRVPPSQLVPLGGEKARPDQSTRVRNVRSSREVFEKV